MIPVNEAFIANRKIDHLTVVADAAVISSANISALTQAHINYIVGARLGNVSAGLLDRIDRGVLRKDGHMLRIKTEKGFLICSYSEQRYRKDKYEMDKQIERAKKLLEQPAKTSPIKFLKTEGGTPGLHEELTAKTNRLLGIKGY